MRAFLFTLVIFFPSLCPGADARALMEESLRRHAEPAYVYEELTLVSSDAAGNYTVRTARHYLRAGAEGSQRLVVIDTPLEAKGSAVLIARGADGKVRREIILPAVKPVPDARREDPVSPAGRLFGTDFTLADLDPPPLGTEPYESEGDQDLERVTHHVLRSGERRLFLRKDNLYISRIDYNDRQGRTLRRETFRDARPDASGAWRASMVLIEDLREGHRTVLKVDRRVHSADYVPASVFE
jgi:hypothetical protein